VSEGAVAATLPVVRTMLEQARSADYKYGVIGIRTRPEWNGIDAFDFDDVPVRVRTCVSALAVREALVERDRAGWLVILTDRSDAELGAGVLSHLLRQRLLIPDALDAARHRFAATTLASSMTRRSDYRDLATGLLACEPLAGWPPAPGGVLTLDHALGAVATAHLGVTGATIDAQAVLAWTCDPQSTLRIGDLRQRAGATLVDGVLSSLAGKTGAARDVVGRLLLDGRGQDVVPLGLVVGTLAAGRASRTSDLVTLAHTVGIRLEERLSGLPPEHAMRAWATESEHVALTLPAPTADAVVRRADETLRDLQAIAHGGLSDLLPSGLTQRFVRLGERLRAQGADGELALVEASWDAVTSHRAFEGDRRTPPFTAAVRLRRWLATPDAEQVSFSSRVELHLEQDSWVDSAVNDAARGVSEADLGAGLEVVLRQVRERRAEHDMDFAAALVRHTTQDPSLVDGSHAGVWHLEEVIALQIMPITRTAPVLLLVLDGMSVAVGNEVLADVVSRASDGWLEALLPGRERRAGAIALLPTLTEVSRASLLSGQLAQGGQSIETRGYEALLSSHGLTGTLFHKKPLDSSRPGFLLADDVGAAVDDVTGQRLVTCVLNTIDDALDRSDPSGTEWGAEAVRHLEPLLTRARLAGRIVVLTADHGHIVERREGTMRSHSVITSGRSRVPDDLAGQGELFVEGRRVIAEGGRAVLAVDERLRYGPLKAGYHGGACPAEVVVPVTVLVNGAAPEGLSLAPPQQPTWWDGAVEAADLPQPVAPTFRRAGEPPTLFDDVEPDPPPASQHAVAAQVLSSATYGHQKSLAGRVSLEDRQVASILTALLLSPAHRLTSVRSASALEVAHVNLRGALAHLQRLLNVDGYAVVTLDRDGDTLVLDVALLRDQFELEA